MNKRRAYLTIGAIVILAALVLAGGAALRRVYVFPVIMYHSVDDKENTTKLSVSPEGFAKQMAFFHKYKYNVIGLEQALPYISGRSKAPPRTVVITFDDGYENNYLQAYPVLKRYGLQATIFVIVDKIGQPGWMTWDQLKEMSDSGLITIGSHTKSHLWLPSLDRKGLKEELVKSKEILEKRLGKRVNLLCYPVGAFDDNVKRAAREAGYTCAVGTNPGKRSSPHDIYAIKRIRISRTSNNPIVLWLETAGWYTWIKENRDDD